MTVIPKLGHVPYAASLLRANVALWWHETCEANRQPVTWDDFCCILHEQFWPEYYSHHGRDELAGMWQYGKESVADIVFHFGAIYLKIQDLSEAEKMDHFAHALVPEVRLQVELRSPLNFHEAAMYAKHADAMIVCISGQDTRKSWQKSYKGGSQQCPLAQVQQ